jgi:hypothetical protein
VHFSRGVTTDIGFISDFKDHEKREPNQEEMIEVVIFGRTEEIREAILKSE